MLSPFERMIAWRYLRTRRKESFISVIVGFSLIGIALGVMTLIVVTSVMNGVRQEMLRHFVGLSGHVQVYGQGIPIQNYQDITARIKAMEGVATAMPTVEGQVMVTANGQAKGAQVKAFLPDDLAAKGEVEARMKGGDWQAFLNGDGLLTGIRMAQNMMIREGQSVTLISPDGRRTVVGVVPRMKGYPVVGVFEFGMSSIDNSLILMPFEEAQTFFKLLSEQQDAVTGIEITLHDLDAAADVAQKIQAMLGPNYRVYDWQQSNASVFEALNVQRTVMFLILTMIILVAAFNIIASLVMLVKDKHRDIAVLRSMGASAASVQRVFMVCGTLIGVVGTGIGLVLGLLLAHNLDSLRLGIENMTGQKLLGEQLYFLNSLPAEVDPFQVLAVVAMALGLSFLATLYPARRAAKLDPAEALRYE